MEVRGIGIINVAAMFGVKASARKSAGPGRHLKAWNDVQDVDRLGMEQEFVKILGWTSRTSPFPCGPAAIWRG
jgi:serine kinase of HPr protein (carbohydrate metabolism regulator)